MRALYKAVLSDLLSRSTAVVFALPGSGTPANDRLAMRKALWIAKIRGGLRLDALIDTASDRIVYDLETVRAEVGLAEPTMGRVLEFAAAQ